jgi:putative flippase GtrA
MRRMPSTSERTTLSERLVHLWEKRNTPEAVHLFKYTMVSVVSTIVSFGVLFLVFGVFKLWGEITSTIIANAAATLPSYYLNRKWVWGKGGRSHLTKEIIPFWSLSAIGIAVSIFGAAAAKHIGTVHHLSHTEQTALVLAANLFSFGIFWVLKFIIFNRMFHVHTLEELDELVEAA